MAPLADDYSVDHISVLSQVKIFPGFRKIFHIHAVTLDIRILIFELMRPPALVAWSWSHPRARLKTMRAAE